MQSTETHPIGVKVAAKNEIRFYTVWAPEGVGVTQVQEALEGDFKITTLRVGDWYPQVIYRCEQLHGWKVTNGLATGGGRVDILL